MKKNIKKSLGILLLLILFIPCFVKADMGAPMFTQYEVRVTNPNGTIALDINGKEVGTINYDEIIKVVYEKIIENELYVGDISKMVKLSDTKLVTEDVDLEKFKKERKEKYYVFDNTNVLYKGPSKTYGKVEPETTLKEGSIVETQYYDQLWAYVEQDGVKGWVYTYTYKNVGPYDDETGMVLAENYNYYQKIKTINETNIYKTPKEHEIIATIPKNTDLEIIYVYADEPHYPHYYVSYNGKEGWIKQSSMKLEEKYYYDNLLYKSKNTAVYKVINDDGISMYNDYNSTSEVLEIIPNNTVLDVKYILMGNYTWNWYQVEYNGKIGWVKGEVENVKSEVKDDTEVFPEEQPETEIPTPEEETNSEENQTENNLQTNEKNLNPREIIIICVTTAIVASLTAFVTIKLVNKKKESQI